MQYQVRSCQVKWMINQRYNINAKVWIDRINTLERRPPGPKITSSDNQPSAVVKTHSSLNVTHIVYCTSPFLAWVIGFLQLRTAPTFSPSFHHLERSLLFAVLNLYFGGPSSAFKFLSRTTIVFIWRQKGNDVISIVTSQRHNILNSGLIYSLFDWSVDIFDWSKERQTPHRTTLLQKYKPGFDHYS